MKRVKQIVKQGVRETGQGINKSADLASKSGVPGGIRTHDPLLRRQLLYPLSYRDNFIPGFFS